MKYKTDIEERLRKKRSMRLLDAADYLFQNPYLTITELKDHLKVGYPTAKFVVDSFLRREFW